MSNLKDIIEKYQYDLTEEKTAWVVFWNKNCEWQSSLIPTRQDDSVKNPQYYPITWENKKLLEEIHSVDNNAVLLNHCCFKEKTVEELMDTVLDNYGNQEYGINQFMKERKTVLTNEELAKITQQNIPKTFNKQEFLESEFCAYLIHTVEQWDKALANNDMEISTLYSYYWSGVKDALEHFTGIEFSFSRTDDYCGIISEDDDWLFKIR